MNAQSKRCTRLCVISVAVVALSNLVLKWLIDDYVMTFEIIQRVFEFCCGFYLIYVSVRSHLIHRSFALETASDAVAAADRSLFNVVLYPIFTEVLLYIALGSLMWSSTTFYLLITYGIPIDCSQVNSSQTLAQSPYAKPFLE